MTVSDNTLNQIISLIGTTLAGFVAWRINVLKAGQDRINAEQIRINAEQIERNKVEIQRFIMQEKRAQSVVDNLQMLSDLARADHSKMERDDIERGLSDVR